MPSVSMSEMNKQANAIINEAVKTGETVTITHRGRPIAEILPVVESASRLSAIEYVSSVSAVPVNVPIGDVIESGRHRGLS